ncbi:MAG: tRNA (adenosine(37)-N6)-dimethylallyltransferase MiaA [Puniceicoccales bacterium]|jgi:tRNA dimethylallyltransferase|nr:tRNA (adenosine(37)-N6)-dimethylallyltransferase MiaA [Puniceicoccales bacterium]
MCASEEKRPVLHVVTGPTASGKTALALELACALGAEIVSCDSSAVYRGMDIGTAKPSAAQRALVPHHCLDIAEPDAPFSVCDYIAAARAAIAGILARGRAVVIAGGSGFYLKAFYRAVVDDIPVPPEVAGRVRQLAMQGPAALEAALLPFAPDRPAFLDWENPRRLAKALERCLASGLPLVKIRERFLGAPGAFDDFAKRTLLLAPTPETHPARIEARVHAMLDAGLVDEVRNLSAAGKLPEGMPAAAATGYRETLQWLRDGQPGGTPALAAAISLSTRQLAAKQRKWFRTQIPVDEIRPVP